VIPIYFVGQNSWLFQLASHLSMTLRQSLILHETARRIGSVLEVHIGRAIPYADLERFDRDALLHYLRQRTFALASSPDGFTAPPAKLLRPAEIGVYKDSLVAQTTRQLGFQSRRLLACE
jgi:hypothetical protein